MRPDVSLVIVSWNTRTDLSQCLHAVSAAAGQLMVEVIVVDNGSSDGTQAMLAGEFPHVRVIQNRDNVGYGRANNIGARAGTGRALLILNSDCELQPGSLQAMVAELERDASIGMVLCRILNPDRSLQPSVHESLPSPWSHLGDLFFLSSLRYALYRCPALHRWLLRSTVKAHQRTRDVAWGGGMCMLIRRELFDALGGFDERFFMYCEDMDLCKRIRDAGYRVRYLAEPCAVHGWGKSTAQLPERMLEESCKSRVRYFEKHYPGWGGSVSLWVALRTLDVRIVLFSLLSVLAARHRQAWRDRVAAGRRCRQSLRECFQQPEERVRWSGGEILPLLLMVVILFSGVRYLHDIAKALAGAPFVDFAHYYTYGTAVARGIDPYDVDAIAKLDGALNMRRAGGGAGYPPLFYLFMQLWVWLPFRLSSAIWFVVNQVMLFAALLLCFRRYATAAPVQIVLGLFVVFNYQPLFENVVLGQSNVLLLFLVVLAWWGLRAGRCWTAAMAVGLVPHIKPQFGLLLPLLWWMGYGRVCVRALAVVAAGLGVGLIVLGPAQHANYLHYILTLPDHQPTWIGNLSPRGTLHRLVDGIDRSGAFASLLVMALDAALVIVFARATRGPVSSASARLDWSWSLGVVAAMLLSPFTEEHHFVLLLFPLLLLLLGDAVPSMPQRERAALVLAILLLGSRFSLAQFPAFHQGALSLLTAGKLLGVAALGWVLLRRLAEPEHVQP